MHRDEPLPKDRRHALPAFSTETRKQAEQLRTLFCRRSRTDPDDWRWTNFDGTLDGLGDATRDMTEMYSRMMEPNQ